MEGHHAKMRALQVFNLKEDATLADIREAYLERTTQKRFRCVFLGDEHLEKDFLKYYEAYMLFLKYQETAEEEMKTGELSTDRFFTLHFNQGVYYLIKERYLKASEKFQAAFKLNQNHAQLLVYLGIVLLKRRNLYAAEKYLSQASELDPECADSWFYLGEIYRLTGKPDKAAEMFQHAKRLDPLRQDVTSRLKTLGARPGDTRLRPPTRNKDSLLSKLLRRSSSLFKK